ncbi:MAG: methyltransferase domain-containing protein [Candidatus Omnitrophota bacterium]
MRGSEFYDILACPKCKVQLNEKKGLYCPECGCTFAVTGEGKPVLIDPDDPETSEFKERLMKEEKERTGAGSLVRSRRLSRLLGFLKPPSFSLNTSFPQVREALFENTGTGSPRVLFIGGMRKSDLKYFDFAERVVIDINDSPTVDMIADAHKLPFVAQSFDILICQAVLEHVIDDEEVLQEIYRVLKHGGLAYVSIPFIQPYHSSPCDFRRFTLTGLESRMKSYRRIASGVASGPGSAMARLIVVFAMSLSDNQLLRRAAFYIFGWLFFWLKYLDLFLHRKKYAHLMCAAVYYVGKKEDAR